MSLPPSMPMRTGSTCPAATSMSTRATSSPRLMPVYVPAGTGTASSSRSSGAAGTEPETVPTADQPAGPWIRSCAPAIESAE